MFWALEFIVLSTAKEVLALFLQMVTPSNPISIYTTSIRPNLEHNSHVYLCAANLEISQPCTENSEGAYF